MPKTPRRLVARIAKRRRPATMGYQYAVLFGVIRFYLAQLRIIRK